MSDGLTALFERYRSSLPEKRGSIMAAFAAWRADVTQLENLRELCRLLHKLSGSAGGYGYVPLGETARTADGLLHEWLSDPPEEIAQRTALALRLEPLMHALDELFESAIDVDAAPDRSNLEFLLRPIQVLLVDDDQELVVLLTEQLRQEGIDVRATGNGAGMHQLLNERRPDVLVLDFWLQDETGDDLARAVRGRPGLSGLPAVCLTSDRTPETRQRALTAGALDVIDKSTPPRQLAGMLRMFAGRAA